MILSVIFVGLSYFNEKLHLSLFFENPGEERSLSQVLNESIAYTFNKAFSLKT